MKKIFKSKLFKQIISFLMVSGIGWIIDFIIYSILTTKLDLNLFVSNILSSLPAITYVYLMSNKKIFSKNKSNLSIKIKYALYVTYQLILLLFISFLAQFCYNILMSTNLVECQFILTYAKILIKIFITPITMTLNFLVMKYLVERL